MVLEAMELGVGEEQAKPEVARILGVILMEVRLDREP
jgi:hypothetical protein